MDITVNVYVGADNATGTIDTDKIAAIAARRHDGFTILPALGYWQGQSEPSVMIVIADDSDKISATVSDLGRELAQDAIAVQTVNPLTFVSDYR
jgi:hypothetical protein